MVIDRRGGLIIVREIVEFVKEFFFFIENIVFGFDFSGDLIVSYYIFFVIGRIS